MYESKPNMRYAGVISQFLEAGLMPKPKYKIAIDQIHTDAVRHVVHALSPNPIPGVPPPRVDKSETALPCTLARHLLDKIHSSAVRFAIDDLGPNHLLGHCSPPVYQSERFLPRDQKVALAQL